MDSDLSGKTLLTIAQGLDLVFISENELLIQFGTRSRPSELLRDADVTGILKKTVGRLLKAPKSLQELLDGLTATDAAEARKLIVDLIGRGIITDLSRSPVEQYLKYTFTGEPAAEGKSVSVIGNGPIGARLAHSLLLHGITRIVLLDDRKSDELWASLLPLGHQLYNGHVQRASMVLCDALRAAGYEHVESLETELDISGLETAILKSDFCVLALEQPSLRIAHLINRICIRHRKPWMLATIDGNFGLVGPLFLPIHTACYNDYQVLSDAATPNPGFVRKLHQHMNDRPASSFFPGLPSYAEIVSGFSSLAIVNFLLRETSFALGRVMVIDFDRMAIEVEDVLKLPRCPVCGREKSAYRPPFNPELLRHSPGPDGSTQQETQPLHEA